MREARFRWESSFRRHVPLLSRTPLASIFAAAVLARVDSTRDTVFIFTQLYRFSCLLFHGYRGEKHGTLALYLAPVHGG